MPQIFASLALLPQGWARDVRLTFDAGKIIGVESGLAGPMDTCVGILLPAPTNLHSHAFQRAMAGLTEQRGSKTGDSFWTWRQLMFRFLEHLGPDDIEAITAFAQMEMLEAGYAAVAEFHYLHHQPDGQPYANRAELSDRITAAAADSGIGLTLLPVLYSQGGVDGRALGAGQIRFGNTLDGYRALLEGAEKAVADLPADAGLGVAPHSLRAVTPADLNALQSHAGPIHMHLAEQQAEVDEINHAYGARPVSWALDNLDLDARWCLIHCTQMTPAEAQQLARTGAVAGLCPITESSLGDGIFDAPSWRTGQGRWGIGTDSNILISLTQELRMLEYSQRLRTHARAVLATPDRSTGRALFDQACAGGAQAAGRQAGAIAVGNWADLIALDGEATDFVGRSGDQLLDTWIFAGTDARVQSLWAAGRQVVKEGQHVKRDEITKAYRKTLLRLKDVM